MADIIMAEKMERYRQRRRPAKPSIFKVPPFVRSTSPDAYEPKLVSIGPYHHGKSSLQAVEEIKWLLLDHLLSEAPKEGLHLLLNMMHNMEEKARSYYSQVIGIESHKFTEMLLLDGCFIIQYFSGHRRMAEELQGQLNVWSKLVLLQDLLLIENQIPYFIFEPVLGVLNIPGLKSLLDLQNAILELLHDTFPLNMGDFMAPEQHFEVVHILHLFHEWILSIPRENESNTPKYKEPLPLTSLFSIPSATELMEAGVKIKKSKARNFLDISFDNGVLKIPAISVHNFTNLILRNFIALEQFYLEDDMQISCYSMFMDSIVNTESDVAVLGHEKIVERWLGTDADIANVFNGLGKDLLIPKQHYLNRLFVDVNAYCNRSWHRWRARLMHDYFCNPWAIISVIAAAILLVLTFLQAIVSILSYKQQINSTKHQ